MNGTLAQFLNEHSVKGQPYTHTRIPEKTANVFGGTYAIPAEHEDQFYNLMYKEVICGNRLEYLTEKQHDNGPIYVDLDLHYKYECTERQHDKDWIEELICIYLTNLKKLMKVDVKPFKLFIMEKDAVNRVVEKNITKDGIHILIGINCPHKLQEKLRELVMADCTELMQRLPLVNDLNGVFDDGLSKGCTNAQLFGCRKPLHDAYKLTHAYNVVIDPVDNEFRMPNYPIELTKETFMQLCVRNKHLNAEFEFTKLSNSVLNPDVIEYADVNLTGCNTDIQKLLAIIGSARCGPQKYKEWVAVAQAIKNETKDEGLNDFVAWTNEFGTDNKKKEAIIKYQKEIKYTPKKELGRVGIGSLHYWAKTDNPQAYRIAFQSQKQTEIVIEPDMADKFKLIDPIIASPADYAIAFAYNKIYDGLQKCVDRQRKEFYCFDEKSKLWNFDIGGTPIRNRISTEFHAIFDKYIQVKQNEAETFEPNSKECEANKKIVKSMCELMIRLQKTNDKNNIMTELGDICKDVKFPSTLNRCEYLIPTNDGKVLDMRTLELTDRTINHNFSFVCNAKLIPYDATHEHFIKAKDYFDELFCGNKDTISCVINILKSVFIGRPLRYIYFCIGVGSNGKSLLFKILNKIFGEFMDIISQSVIIQPKGNKSALNTEVEKLDKCRVGYITEVKETDDLNEIVIKQITGGDAINLRTLHTKDHTINPTCNTFVLTNEFPKFNGDAVSMQNRMIAIPFKKIFEVKDGFEKEMLEISDYIFSYVMHTGIICDKFNLSTEMVEEMEKHRKNNTETALADYMKIRFADCENNNTTNKLILINDVRVDFIHYCERYKITNKIEQKKFPAKMRELGYKVKESGGKNVLYNKKFIDIVIPDIAPENDTEDNTDGDIDE
jgi:phage/plasmid-associated DNA primase